MKVKLFKTYILLNILGVLFAGLALGFLTAEFINRDIENGGFFLSLIAFVLLFIASIIGVKHNFELKKFWKTGKLKE